MEPESNYSWEDIVRNLSSFYKDKKSLRAEEPDKDDLEILNLLKGYLAKYLEQFFENPDDVVREVLKARDEEIKRLENKIKELEEKIDNLLLRIPTPTPGIPEEGSLEPYKPYTSSPWTTTPIDPIWYGGGIGITL